MNTAPHAVIYHFFCYFFAIFDGFSVKYHIQWKQCTDHIIDGSQNSGIEFDERIAGAFDLLLRHRHQLAVDPLKEDDAALFGLRFFGNHQSCSDHVVRVGIFTQFRWDDAQRVLIRHKLVSVKYCNHSNQITMESNWNNLKMVTYQRKNVDRRSVNCTLQSPGLFQRIRHQLQSRGHKHLLVPLSPKLISLGIKKFNEFVIERENKSQWITQWAGGGDRLRLSGGRLACR